MPNGHTDPSTWEVGIAAIGAFVGGIATVLGRLAWMTGRGGERHALKDEIRRLCEAIDRTTQLQREAIEAQRESDRRTRQLVGDYARDTRQLIEASDRETRGLIQALMAQRRNGA